jgi:ribosome-binding factor A
METNRQRKIAELIQKDMVEILQGEIRKNNIKNIVISVTHVNVTSDLGIARIYLSIFPNEKAKDLLEAIKSNHILIRHNLSQLVKNQLRRVPELLFYHDDTSERAEHIEQALKGEDNPIKKPDLLISRKKS